MAKKQYHFNEKTLTFSAHEKSFKQKVGSFFVYILSSSILAIAFIFVFTYFFESPKEKRQAKEISELKFYYEMINKEIDEIDDILNQLQERDDNIYRTIFEAEPIPSTIRNAGFGGTYRYNNLKELISADLVIDTKTKLDILTKKLYVQSNSFDEVVELAKNKEKMLMSIPSIMPVTDKDLKRVASGWGWRIHPIDKVRKFHEGMDFSAATGTEIHATGNGIIETLRYSSSYGNMIVINHGYKHKSLYAHLSGFNVKKGQKVTRGQVIGFVGNTGRSMGAHLHYEVIRNGKKVDPKDFYFNDLTPEQYDEMIAISAELGQSLD